MGYNAGGQLSGSSLTDSSLYKNESASPDSSDPTASLPRDGRPHRRGYQACQRCRERKVKCDLGSECAPSGRETTTDSAHQVSTPLPILLASVVSASA